MKLKQLLFGLLLACLFTSCEQKSIDTEIERLKTLEIDLNKSISEKNT